MYSLPAATGKGDVVNNSHALREPLGRQPVRFVGDVLDVDVVVLQVSRDVVDLQGERPVDLVSE